MANGISLKGRKIIVKGLVLQKGKENIRISKNRGKYDSLCYLSRSLQIIFDGWIKNLGTIWSDAQCL